MPKSKLVVLTAPDGQLAGWAGMDAETNPEIPLLFSHYVDPEYRGLKLDALLEHVWWAYLSAWGCKKGYLRLELGNNKRLLRHRLATEYYGEVTEQELVTRYVDACHYYDLYFCDNKSHAYFLIDVEEALAASLRRRGELDICRLPISIRI